MGGDTCPRFRDKVIFLANSEIEREKSSYGPIVEMDGSLT